MSLNKNIDKNEESEDDESLYIAKILNENNENVKKKLDSKKNKSNDLEVNDNKINITENRKSCINKKLDIKNKSTNILKKIRHSKNIQALKLNYFKLTKEALKKSFISKKIHSVKKTLFDNKYINKPIKEILDSKKYIPRLKKINIKENFRSVKLKFKIKKEIFKTSKTNILLPKNIIKKSIIFLSRSPLNLSRSANIILSINKSNFNYNILSTFKKLVNTDYNKLNLKQNNFSEKILKNINKKNDYKETKNIFVKNIENKYTDKEIYKPKNQQNNIVFNFVSYREKHQQKQLDENNVKKAELNKENNKPCGNCR